MEAKKSKKAAIENQRGSWLLMGLVVALAFMFVSFGQNFEILVAGNHLKDLLYGDFAAGNERRRSN